MMPHLNEWVCATEVPDAAPLLQYASALMASRRLEELGYLAVFLARVCRDRPLWDGAIREFVLEVDRCILKRLGGKFAPLGALKQQLALA